MRREKNLPPMARQGQSSSRSYVVVGLALLAIGVLWLLSSSWTTTKLDPLGSSGGSLQIGAVDMHSHSTESDGDRTAEEQITLAKKMQANSLWITDHDLIRDLPRVRELQQFAKDKGISVGFGVEITVGWAKKEHHLLGYFPDVVWSGAELSPAMQTLQIACAQVKSSRENRNQMMVAFLNKKLSPATGGPDGDVYFTNVAKRASFQPLSVATVAVWARENANLLEPTSLGRPHFSKYLMTVVGINKDLIFGPRQGDGVALVTSDGGIFWESDKEGKQGKEVVGLMHSTTLAKEKIAFEPLPIVEAIQLINKAGGRAVIAHITTLGSAWVEKFGPLVPELCAAGLWGIEGFSSEIDADNHNAIHDLAKTNGLHLTGGSDNHGTLKSYAKLGIVHRDGQEAYTALESWAHDGRDVSDKIHTGTDL